MSPREPFIPPVIEETARQRILALLEEGEASALEISGRLGIAEKDVIDHLGHLERTLRREGRRVEVTPASCLGCGFVFTKRGRFSAPGRCPSCRDTHIAEPRFSLR